MIPPHRSEVDLIVLHGLRCCGASSLERLHAVVAPVVGGDVEDTLLALASQGMVTSGGGPFGGWSVTATGRDTDAERIAAELERAGARAEIQAAYGDFLPLNTRTLDLCGQWQVRSFSQPLVLNDHADPAYDAGVLARLAGVDAEAQEICARLAGRLQRFAHYGPRLDHALARAKAGERDMVSDSLDSYHSVWFQLHEDLLVTLGIPRHA